MNQSPLHNAVLFHLGPVPVSAQVAVTWVIMAVLAGGSWLITSRIRSERPSRPQALVEWFVDILADQIRSTMRTEPERYLALIGTIFLFILFANLSSLVPGNEPPTAHLETDAALALIAFCAAVVYGVRTRGLRGYLRSFAEPTWYMAPLNVVENITRTFSMMVRLFGNILSGVFIVGIILSLAGLFVPIPFMALDVLTAVIQAYIFSVLAMVLIGAAINEESAESAQQEKP